MIDEREAQAGRAAAGEVVGEHAEDDGTGGLRAGADDRPDRLGATPELRVHDVETGGVQRRDRHREQSAAHHHERDRRDHRVQVEQREQDGHHCDESDRGHGDARAGVTLLTAPVSDPAADQQATECAGADHRHEQRRGGLPHPELVDDERHEEDLQAGEEEVADRAAQHEQHVRADREDVASHLASASSRWGRAPVRRRRVAARRREPDAHGAGAGPRPRRRRPGGLARVREIGGAPRTAAPPLPRATRT